MWKASDEVAIKCQADCKVASLAPRRHLSELSLLRCTPEKYSQVISTVFEESDATPRHIGNLRMQFTATWLKQRHGGNSRDFSLMTTILSIGLRPVASFVHSDSREADVGRVIHISCDSALKLYPFRVSDLQFFTRLHLARGCLAFLARCYPRIFLIDADGHLIWMLCVWLTGLRTPQEMGDQAQWYAVSLQTPLILVILHLQLSFASI